MTQEWENVSTQNIFYYTTAARKFSVLQVFSTSVHRAVTAAQK